MNRDGIAASIGPVGAALDNAQMESTIGLHETELIKPQRPWKTPADVELATAEWGDRCNHRPYGQLAKASQAFESGCAPGLIPTLL
ncbi:hypothetical protein [Streptomyces sp. NPDC059949]|uniref:hypothetical protein n=1 Tax=Streptomyces sp. NPDC059949 TaxID=3347013 RepID=UPI003658B9A4